MDTMELMYELLQEVRKLQEIDHDILLEHKRMSESNKKRIDILEKRAYIINWKQIGTLTGIIAAIASIAYTVSRVI